MGVSTCAQVIEVYMLSRIIETDKHESLSEEQIVSGMKDRYRMSWIDGFRGATILLSISIHGCGLIGPLDDGGYIWVFGVDGERTVKCTGRIHPASIETYRERSMDGSAAMEGWGRLFADAVAVFEYVYDERGYQEACIEHECEVKGIKVSLEGGQVSAGLPF